MNWNSIDPGRLLSMALVCMSTTVMCLAFPDKQAIIAAMEMAQEVATSDLES